MHWYMGRSEASEAAAAAAFASSVGTLPSAWAEVQHTLQIEKASREKDRQ